jgi:cell division protein FtsI (penicillin-binding protein 3)
MEPVGIEAMAPLDSSLPAPVAAERPGVSAVSTQSSSIPTTTLLLVAWALGFATVLTRLAYGLLGARRLARRARYDEIGPFEEVIGEARRVDLRTDVAISDDVATPAVAGIFRPVVLMPRAALAWSKSRWHVVLLHELAHVRSRDCLVNVVAELLCAVHWFDPLAWLMRAQWRKTRELAADEDVVLRGVLPSDYATHLLDVASDVGARAIPRGALAMAGQRSELARRLERIVVRGETRSPSRRLAIAIPIGGGILTLVVACAGPPSPYAPEQRLGETAVSNPPEPASGLSAATPNQAVAGSIADIATKVVEVIGGSADSNELTIDPRLQAIAEEEAARVVSTAHAREATAIVLDPAKGEILALANPDVARRACITGSTMKAVTIAAALDADLVRVDQKFDCTPRKDEVPGIQDEKPRGWLGLGEIMEVSSNVGALRVYQALGDARFERALERFHFDDDEPAVQLKFARFARPGAVERFVTPAEEAKGAVGEGFVSTPLQMLAAYAVFANGGEYVAPSLVRSVRDESGRTYWRYAPKRERVMRIETAGAVMAMLERAVNGANATGKAARVPGVRVAGKTGTSALHGPDVSQVYASFIGIVPVDAPRYVILVGAINPAEGGWGGTVAAPAFARIATRALALE